MAITDTSAMKFTSFLIVNLLAALTVCGQSIDNLTVENGETIVIDNQEIGGYPVQRFETQSTRELILVRKGTLIVRNSRVGGIEGNSVRCIRVSPRGPVTLIIDRCTFFHCRGSGPDQSFDADHIVIQRGKLATVDENGNDWPVVIKITNSTFVLDGTDELRAKRAIKVMDYDFAFIDNNQIVSSSPDANCAIHLSNSKGHVLTRNLVQGIYRDFIFSAVDESIYNGNSIFNERENVDFLEYKAKEGPVLKLLNATSNRLQGKFRWNLRMPPGTYTENVVIDFPEKPVSPIDPEGQ